MTFAVFFFSFYNKDSLPIIYLVTICKIGLKVEKKEQIHNLECKGWHHSDKQEQQTT